MAAAAAVTASSGGPEVAIPGARRMRGALFYAPSSQEKEENVVHPRNNILTTSIRNASN